MKKLFLFSVLAVSLTYSCKKVDSNDLKETVPYYQSYSVYFDKDANSTEASATFRVRDANATRVELSNGASVTANGTAGTTHFLSPTDYKWTFTGIKDVSFVLNKNGGAVLTNTAQLADINPINFGTSFPASANKSAGFSFTWGSIPIANGETLTVTISTPDSASAKTKIYNATNSNQTVTFTPADMQHMATGTMTVEMIRYKSKELDAPDGTSTGSIALRYRLSKQIPLNP
ncbi:hypothetical protein CAP35_08455 [Chitinophagaceae bacterium IBVUCB1]|nr:hypothetical protein CAP35_08455 [Chitinophagaceae bacterium IBVUCB1]